MKYSAELSSRCILCTGFFLFPCVAVLLAQESSPPHPSPDALLQTGLTSLSQGKYPEAEQAFRKVTELDPSDLRGVIGLAEVYSAQKKDDDAIALLQSVSQKFPSRPELHVAMGDAAFRATRDDLAIAEYQQALDHIDRNSKAAGDMYLRLAEAYRRKGDMEFSIDLLRQAQKLQPQNLNISSGVAYMLEASGKREAAVAEYRKLLEATPDNGFVLNNLAFLLSESDPGLALAYALRARQQLPNELTVADTLGWAYLKLNQPGNALAIFRDVVQKEPRRAVFRYHLAAALEQNGEHESARKELQTALQSNPSKDEKLKINELLAKIK